MITILIVLDAALIGFQVEVNAKHHYDALQAARIIDQVRRTCKEVIRDRKESETSENKVLSID